MVPLSRAPQREVAQLASLLHAARLHPTASTAVCRATAAEAGRASHHQRRHSSSKPSSPADGGSVPPEGPTTKEPSAPAAARKRASRAAAATATTSSSGSKSRSGAGGSRASKNATHLEQRRQAQQDGQDLAASLPSVPSTQHLDSSAVNLASFFSLHRPISVTSAVPSSSTSETFSQLFQPKPKSSNSASTIFTLSSAVRVLDRAIAASSSEDFAGDIKISTEDADGRAMYIDLQELASNFRPFHPPPPPVSLEEFEAAENNKKRRPRLTRKKTIPSAQANLDGVAETQATEQPRLRMRERRVATLALRGKAVRAKMAAVQKARDLVRQKGKWLAISVRRQRKLKMKKHKYKKLQRKQKNERSRLGRL